MHWYYIGIVLQHWSPGIVLVLYCLKKASIVHPFWLLVGSVLSQLPKCNVTEICIKLPVRTVTKSYKIFAQMAWLAGRGSNVRIFGLKIYNIKTTSSHINTVVSITKSSIKRYLHMTLWTHQPTHPIKSVHCYWCLLEIL